MLFCLLVVGKLPGPDVLFLEGLVEGFDVAVLFRCVLPDELMFADTQGRYRPSKVVTRILVVVVRP